ncbi:MAG: peptidase domain-containing ABC transporter [Roseivirga sp.]|nr:peptidase domain-containing ABC transporter [Roseivirga sp.]
MRFPFYKQSESKDCGPTCIKIIARHYGKSINTQHLRTLAQTTREGSSMMGLSDAAESVGFRTVGVKINYENFAEGAPLPAIVHWNKNHYAVVYKIRKDKIHVSDPASGLLSYTRDEFITSWIGKNADATTEEGIVLLLEPTPKLFQEPYEQDISYNLKFISKYLLQYKRLLLQLVIGLMAASLLQLVAPFLTQSIVDVGIENQDLDFVYLILIAQLFLFFGRTAIEVIRSWILLHVSGRINISLISDFFIKLMNLPISFFDVKMTGDILQRINDHSRIERILTTSSLNVLFSFLNLIIFGIVLATYSLLIFSIFLAGSVLYFLWIVVFLKKRKNLDYKKFNQTSNEQSKVIELINGMQEIKLHNAEKKKRWAWEHLQARLFKLSIESLALEQYQSIGSSFINELKNILISVISATLVIKGELTLGMMMAISYIVGQLNSPITQLISFIKEVQDAKISLDRLGEIHNMEDEKQHDSEKHAEVPVDRDIALENMSFRYPGSDVNVLKNLSLTIPANKVTAIVGVSGGGKTTLMKVLLKFYEPGSGKIMIGNGDLDAITQQAWRDKCGVVMQEGYIFNDTIASNVAIGDDVIDKEKMLHALEVANLRDFIESLPLAYNTKIGMEGIGLSTGQKQRLLIARAVYKDPRFLFFDEATSALDANNEKTIMENLNRFFENKTVLVIAHRLSTVKNAHQIVVLDQGNVVETGNHKELVALKGSYFELVKNQLELGS